MLLISCADHYWLSDFSVSETGDGADPKISAVSVQPVFLLWAKEKGSYMCDCSCNTQQEAKTQGWVQDREHVSSSSSSIRHCVAAAGLSIPEFVWILQCGPQQLLSWVSWMVVAQVQLSQMGGVGGHSFSQRSTAFLCDQTAWQAADTQNNTETLRELLWSWSSSNVHTNWNCLTLLTLCLHQSDSQSNSTMLPSQHVTVWSWTASEQNKRGLHTRLSFPDLAEDLYVF